MEIFDVVVVGAGPVGLCLSCLLAGSGTRVLLLERRAFPSDTSRAIGITPPTLRIMEGLGLAADLIERGVPVRRAHVHGAGNLGTVSFDHLPEPFQFILSVPQTATEEILGALSATCDNVTLMRGTEVHGLDVPAAGHPVVHWQRRGRSQSARARYVCGCDGARSRVREALGLAFRGGRYERFFLMADFRSNAGLGEDAHLFFTPLGSVESFPLPEGGRRWIAQTTQLPEGPGAGVLETLVAERTGIRLDPNEATWRSSFQPERYESEAMVSGPVALCGDAAHVMAPIGGQGMNTGFADAELLAALLTHRLRQGAGKIPEAYQTYRRRAVRSASRRAASSMNIGTIRGRPWSALRNLFIWMLLHSALQRAVPSHFAMLTIPFGSLSEVVARAQVIE
jgi:2-polyprenyl-6-methoxyphenol hydroxylase-like FAD-dependent oxidoreductase